LTKAAFLVRIRGIMLELLAKLRQTTGRANTKLRKQGFIPAVLYGQKVKNLVLTVKELDFKKIYQEAGESTLIKLRIEGEKERTVLIHDIARDPVNDRVIHIDFNQVKMDEKIVVEVPLVFIGQSGAVDKDEGVLIKSIQSVEVEALPTNLPHEIEVDISVLKTFDDNIYIKNLKLPEKVEIKANPDDVIASVIPPRTQEELEALEETPTEEVEDIEVEEKGKDEEEGKEEVEEEVVVEKETKKEEENEKSS